jgi:hypothetical protein
MGTGGPFLGGKARPGRDADHSPPSSAEVKNEQELYLLSPHAIPWHATGSLYLYMLILPVLLYGDKLKLHPIIFASTKNVLYLQQSVLNDRLLSEETEKECRKLMWTCIRDLFRETNYNPVYLQTVA